MRRALGATNGDVLRLVVSAALRLVVTGAVIGLSLAAVPGRFIGTALFGVAPLDFVTFGVVTLLVAMTAGVSIAGPAWRAVQIDPAEALRTR